MWLCPTPPCTSVMDCSKFHTLVLKVCACAWWWRVKYVAWFSPEAWLCEDAFIQGRFLLFYQCTVFNELSFHVSLTASVLLLIPSPSVPSLGCGSDAEAEQGFKMENAETAARQNKGYVPPPILRRKQGREESEVGSASPLHRYVQMRWLLYAGSSHTATNLVTQGWAVRKELLLLFTLNFLFFLT